MHLTAIEEFKSRQVSAIIHLCFSRNDQSSVTFLVYIPIRVGRGIRTNLCTNKDSFTISTGRPQRLRTLGPRWGCRLDVAMEFLIASDHAQRRVSFGVIRVLYQSLLVVVHGTGQITVCRQQVSHEEVYLRLQHSTSPITNHRRPSTYRHSFPFLSVNITCIKFIYLTVSVQICLVIDSFYAVSYTHLTLPTNREV